MPRQVLVPIVVTTDATGYHRNPVIVGWQWVTVYGDLESRQQQVAGAQEEGAYQHLLGEFRRTEVESRAPRKVHQFDVLEEPGDVDPISSASFDRLGEIGLDRSSVGDKELLGL